MVNWIEYELFSAKKKEIKIVNKQAASLPAGVWGRDDVDLAGKTNLSFSR